MTVDDAQQLVAKFVTDASEKQLAEAHARISAEASAGGYNISINMSDVSADVRGRVTETLTSNGFNVCEDEDNDEADEVYYIIVDWGKVPAPVVGEDPFPPRCMR